MRSGREQSGRLRLTPRPRRRAGGLPLVGCVILGKSPTLSGPRCSPLSEQSQEQPRPTAPREASPECARPHCRSCHGLVAAAAGKEFQLTRHSQPVCIIAALGSLFRRVSPTHCPHPHPRKIHPVDFLLVCSHARPLQNLGPLSYVRESCPCRTNVHPLGQVRTHRLHLGQAHEGVSRP